MIFLHVSDTHGPIPLAKLPTDFDVLCHTGDWAPEPSARYPDRGIVAPYQMEFFRYEARALAAFLGERPLVFCLGNHDVLSEAWVERDLNAAGVNAFAPGSMGASVSGTKFWGMRNVPTINGSFEGELEPILLEAATENILRRAFPDDVLLAHCPPQSVLAGASENQWGNPFLTAALAHEMAPRLVLAGHIHEAFGRATVGRAYVVNSACGWSLVDTSTRKVLQIEGRGR